MLILGNSKQLARFRIQSRQAENSPAQRARGVLRTPVTVLQYSYFARAGRPLGVPGRKVPRPVRPRHGFPPGRRPRGPPKSPKKGQEAPKRPPRWYTRGPRCHKIAPRRPRWPPDAPRGLQEHSQEGPKRHNSLIFIRFWKDFCVSTFSPSRRPKTAQEAPNIAPRGPKRPPRGP